MANKKEEPKKTSVKKSNSNTAKKVSSNSTKKTSTKKTPTTKKNTTKSSKTTTKKTSTKTVNKTTSQNKPAIKKVEKELEKTVIIEDIENKINDIVEKKEEQNTVVAKLENAKYSIKKRNKHLLAVGVVISLLGIIALIITLIANRIVDKEFISDNAIIMMVIASILIEIFGAFIIINES